MFIPVWIIIAVLVLWVIEIISSSIIRKKLINAGDSISKHLESFDAVCKLQDKRIRIHLNEEGQFDIDFPGE
jgi:hypothetical protein